jgi:hypothetical protein
MHCLGHKMSEGLSVQGRCGYCGLTTIDFCDECGIYVCRRCDMPRHWPDVGVVIDSGFAPDYRRVRPRFERK